jgi:hypothetical protein
MRTSVSSLTLIAALATVSFLCLAGPAFAGGAEKTPAPSRPTPTLEKKVFTNDDLPNWGRPSVMKEVTQSEALNAMANLPAAPGGLSAASKPYSPEKDPYWYARQAESLEAELQSLGGKVQQLSRFRQTGTGLPTGLILDAPCEGITTDNEIAQLNLRRQQIEQELDQLGDTARRNDFPPGLFRETAELVQADEGRISLTPAQEQAALLQKLESFQEELVQVQNVVAGMKQVTAARRMTLLLPTGNGGNMTTDLLERLAARANAIRSDISSVEDDARRAGMAPGLLR